MASFYELKDRLINLFFSAKERGFNDNHVRLAKECIEIGTGIDVTQRYNCIPLLRLLEQNNFEYTTVIIACSLILQYITNLFDPDLPPKWWSISTKNPTYIFRIARVKGAEELLDIAGYTVRSGDSKMFPEDKRTAPDKRYLSMIAAELLLARVECEGIVDKRYPDLSSVRRHQEHELPKGRVTSPVIGNTFRFDHTNVPPTSQYYANASFVPDINYISPVTSNTSTTYSNRRMNEDISGYPQYGNHYYTPSTTQWGVPTTDYIRTTVPHTTNIGSSHHYTYSSTHTGGTSPHTSAQQYSSTTGSSPHSSGPQYSGSYSRYSDPRPGGTSPHTSGPQYSTTTGSSPHSSGPQYSGTHSSGPSPHTSGPQYSTTTGSSPHSTPPTTSSPLPDEPFADTLSNKRTKLLQRQVEMLEKLKKLNTETSQGNSSETLPSKATTTNEVTLTNQATPNRPIPKPRVKMATSPVAVLGTTDSSSAISRKPGFSSISEDSISEEDTPLSPKKCTKCQSILSDIDGSCKYCSSDPLPVKRPVPKPRTKLLKPKVPSDEHKPPASSDNSTRVPNYTTPNFTRPPDRITPPGSGNIASRPPDHTTPPSSGNISGPRTSELPPPPHNQDDTDSNSIQIVGKETADSLLYKYTQEVEFFKSLSIEEQRKYLDDKLPNDSIKHLTPYYRGHDLHFREITEEIESFKKLSPQKQFQKLEEKRARGESVDHLMKHYSNEEEMQLQMKESKRQKIIDDGRHFIHWIKQCAPYNFAPEEVEIALKAIPENPLEYLQQHWCSLIEHVRTYVRFKSKKPMGVPSDNEIRLLLIETKGDLKKAGQLCIDQRKKKIDELFKKIDKKFEVKWNDAVDVLTECELDVEESFYALQCRSLTDLYTYLTTDYKVITNGMPEMEYMKDVIIERMKEKEEDKFNSCLRMVMAEFRLGTLEKSKMLVKLLEEGSSYPLKYYIDATKAYNTYEDALKYLNQDCIICAEEYPMDEMVVMPACGESLCKNCFRNHFKITIKERSVKHFNCPICAVPDLSNPDETLDMNLQLFVAMVKELLPKNYELCQKKLTDFNLSKEERFVWCPHKECGCGFINERRDTKKIDCPSCKKSMCFLCKKEWEDQHADATCEEFAKWKTDNDPEAQKAGLAAHLNENGIQCPDCKFRYDLARGGCMHFHCTQCPNEFCSGCYKSFKNGEACGSNLQSCKGRGLHAHHPRDCLYYLRDCDVKDLQKLLDENNVEYDTDPPDAQVNAAKEQKNNPPPPVENEEPQVEVNEEDKPEKHVHVIDGEEIELVCCVMLQKETPNGLKDEECLRSAPVGMAGLCVVHYKEYLVSKINKKGLDPIDLYTNQKIALMLRREEMEVPEQDKDNETEEDYRKRLIEWVVEKMPIKREDNNVLL